MSTVGPTALLLFAMPMLRPPHPGPIVKDVHVFLGILAVAATVALLAAGGWSAIAARRSGGTADHRFAVDRLVLVVIAVLATNELIGLLQIATGQRPADPLHLLYGPVALISLPIGAWLTRRDDRGGGATRRREVWMIGAAVVLLGIELRLIVTG